MSYRIRFLRAAHKELIGLPKGVRELIQRRLDNLAEDPRAGATRALAGNLKGLFRLRVGDYRVSYQVDDEARLVTVWQVGHRSTFYQRAKRRRL